MATFYDEICPAFCAIANAFSLATIWNSWKRCDILWFIFKYFSMQFSAHRSCGGGYFVVINQHITYNIAYIRSTLTSAGLMVRAVKSLTQSAKHNSDSLLYDIRKSENCECFVLC